MSTFARKVLIACVGLLLVNAVGMWTVLYLDHAKVEELMLRQAAFSGSPATTSATNAKMSDEKNKPLEERVGKLESQHAEIDSRVEDLEGSVSDLESAKGKTSSTTSSSKTSQKEYSIYLGTGSTTNRQWETIQSTTLALDTAKYQHISTVYFEASLSTDGGEAYAQLIDANTGAVFSSPQLMNNNPTPTWKSVKVNLTAGNQMYVVQLKSSSGETTVMSGARLRITAD